MTPQLMLALFVGVLAIALVITYALPMYYDCAALWRARKEGRLVKRNP